jgi:hypothetical protein
MRYLLIACILLLALGARSSPPQAADSARALQWAQLIPPEAFKPKSFLFGAPKPTEEMDGPPPPFTEGKFMSIKRRQPGGSASPVVEALNGQRVKIGGYVVPLDFNATSVKEFLLVPFVGACIHVPPPPANQIIYVKAAHGIELKGEFDPVSVTGIIRTTTAFTGLADAGYTLDADEVALITQ